MDLQSHCKKIGEANKFSTVNLSNFKPSISDLTLLEKGLTFIPTRKTLPISNIINDQNKLIRNIKLKYYFRDKSIGEDNRKERRFTLAKGWTPGDDKLPNETLALADKIRLCTSEIIGKVQKENKIKINNNYRGIQSNVIKLRERNNLNKDEQKSLFNIRNNSEIVIKPADKGGATVILNKINYIKEAERQLNNEKYYSKIDKPIYTDNIPKIRKILTEMMDEKVITKDQFNYLIGPEEIKNRTFYLLPKIHKKKELWPQPGLMPEGRPIVSDIDSETYRVSEFIDFHINPLAGKHKSYIKNTYDFIDKLKDFNLPDNILLVTGDVTSLYTNMNIERSINCVRKAFNNYPDIHRPDEYIIKLLEISMKNNDFEFHGKNYLQIMGTAMGKRFAPALANLYLLDFDEQAMNEFRIKPLLFFRYLDDIFALWQGDIESLKEYENFLNTLIPDIKIKLEFSAKEINFLDTTIYRSGDKLLTKVYFKDTDTHQLLHKDSFHPKHTFRGLLRSQFIRFKRISSTKTDYELTSKILISVLLHRGYSHTEMRKIKNDIWYYYIEKETKIDNKNILPITIDYCSISTQLGRNLKGIISQDNFLKKERVLIAYRNSKNLQQMLIRSKLTKNAENGEFTGCGEARCKLCRIHACDTSTFTSNHYNKKFNVKGKVNCKSSNVVYLITCRKCEIQYVGETGRTLKDRMSDHRSAVKLKKNTPIGLHFNQDNHSLLDLKMTGIEIMQNNNEIDRKNKERFWQRTLGTEFPKGLNNLPID